MAEEIEGERPRNMARYTVGLAMFAAALLFLLWAASDALLLIFAALLFASFLDALTRLLGKAVPWGHGIRLAVVCAVLASICFVLIGWGGLAFSAQAGEYISTLREQVNQVLAWLEARGIPLPEAPAAGNGDTGRGPVAAAPEADPRSVARLLPNLEGVFGTAWSAVVILFGILGNAVVIIFLGIFLAAQPTVYRDTALLLLPPEHRGHVGAVLDEAGETLRHWLLGQAVTMLAIFLFVWIGLMLVGVEPSFALGLQAGLLAFIPNIGPLVSGILIVLASLGGGVAGALGGLGIYLGAQMLESYLLTPLIQKRAIDIPPAFLFASQIILGLLFGFYGLALATPIAAIGRVFILRFYVEDTLGDPQPDEKDT